jgi:hypothetical protein
MIGLFSCKNKDNNNYFLTTGAEVIETKHGILAASQSGELLKLNRNTSSLIYKADGSIKLLLAGGKSIVIGVLDESTNDKKIVHINNDGDFLWEIKNFDGYFYNSYIKNNTLYLPLSKLQKIDLNDINPEIDSIIEHRDPLIKYQDPLKKEDVLIELMKKGKVLFFHDLLFFSENSAARNYMKCEFSKLFRGLHKISLKTRGFFANKKNSYLINETFNSSLKVIKVSNTEKTKTKNLSLVEMYDPKFKFTEKYMVVYDLYNLFLYSVNDFSLKASFSSNEPFIIGVILNHDLINIVTKDNLYKYNFHSSSYRDKRNLRKVLKKRYNAKTEIK